jgi:ArsR family transcriptional regulator
MFLQKIFLFRANTLTSINVLWYTMNKNFMRGVLIMGKYEEYATLFKALGNVNRVMIVDMLSCGELCACSILEHFQITQPTLSHHMKILCDCDLTVARKEGKWTYYSLNAEKVLRFKEFLNEITSPTDDCICHQINCECDCQ